MTAPPHRRRVTKMAVTTALTLTVLIALAACTKTPTLTAPPPPTLLTASATIPALPVPATSPACGRPGHSAALSHPASLDEADPSAVSCAVLVLLWSLDTTTSSSTQTQHTGELRAAASGYLTVGYAAQLRTQQPVPSPLWPLWTRHHAYLSLRLTLAPQTETPPDTAERAFRQWQIITTPIGRDGWRGPPIEHIAFVTLTRTPPASRWQVKEIRY